MSHIDVQQMIGPSSLMVGSELPLSDAIRLTEQRFPERSFCIVDEWIWIDFDAPDLVNMELANAGKQPVMLLVFNVLHDSSSPSNSNWFRSTPLTEFVDDMFFLTEHKIYVLLGHGRRTSMPLSAVVRLF
ncbi:MULTISPECIES: DUF6957 family protein [Pseudomonas syringae group genomosp. 2]|uniref:DUF6957 family protein n=1 Tax=Pseudomonas syringae group genomosp. 2 TaxID=251698 RepID=UPI000F01047D|nr:MULTISPECIES: hypothetical protein [Pseudomonas syringae group genomosp. 2]